jgi:GNAT superfamily N-acetyltransferase
LSTIDIRLFRDGDRDELIALLRTVFDGWHADPLAHWKWLYESNPHGRSSIGIALEAGRIAASYSACPVRMQWGAERILVGHAIDAATHPAFRRRGLFERVAEAAIADADRRGFGFILAYTQWGGASASGQTQKLGFTRAFRVKRLVKILHWPSALAFKIGLPRRLAGRAEVSSTLHAIVSAAAAAGISVADAPDPSSTTPLARAIRVEKSARHVRWRYSDHPEARYRVFSVVSAAACPASVVLALRTDKGIVVGQIVDLFGDEEHWNALLSGLETAVSASGVTLLEALVSEGHPAARTLKSRGYRDRPEDVAGIIRPTRHASPDSVRLASMPEAWHVMLGDDSSL